MGQLTDDDLRRFALDGYLVISGVVPEELLAAADREVDALVVADPKVGDGDGGVGRAFWFAPTTTLPRCHDVLRATPVRDLTRELTAPHEICVGFDTIQVATTIPPHSHIPGAPHIDGHGPDGERIDSFTLLAGVALTDQRTPQSGALWVWPGSHLDHQRMFRERGTRVLQQVFGHACLLDPPVWSGPGIELPMARGDLLLAHYLLGHNSSGNTGPGTRRTLYGRLIAPGHADRWEQTFVDPWTEYPPVRRVLVENGV